MVARYNCYICHVCFSLLIKNLVQHDQTNQHQGSDFLPQSQANQKQQCLYFTRQTFHKHNLSVSPSLFPPPSSVCFICPLSFTCPSLVCPPLSLPRLSLAPPSFVPRPSLIYPLSLLLLKGRRGRQRSRRTQITWYFLHACQGLQALALYFVRFKCHTRVSFCSCSDQ